MYVSGDITPSLALAALKAAHVPIDASNLAAKRADCNPCIWKMRLDGGHLTRWCPVGGQVCDEETYAFADAHTMLVQDVGGPCVAKLAVRWQGSELHLTVLAAPCNRDFLVVSTVSYGATPWTRQP